jgi:ketosteroid isomerase-like protein
VEKPMKNEEVLLRMYVDRFNAHDIEAVMDCFDDDAVVIDHEGRRFEGRDAIRGFYEWQFRVIPDGRCELRHVVSQPGSGMAETRFIGTVSQTGKTVEALGPEVATFAGNKIKELRDYHRLTAV